MLRKWTKTHIQNHMRIIQLDRDVIIVNHFFVFSGKEAATQEKTSVLCQVAKGHCIVS